jgi:hypothetical protein
MYRMEALTPKNVPKTPPPGFSSNPGVLFLEAVANSHVLCAGL